MRTQNLELRMLEQRELKQRTNTNEEKITKVTSKMIFGTHSIK